MGNRWIRRGLVVVALATALSAGYVVSRAPAEAWVFGSFLLLAAAVAALTWPLTDPPTEG